ncbi:MAG: dethiobiotin synthase, partial [Jatrophihabitantaceae bacterium]
MSVLIVTGTGTDVGKTVVTAAIAACAKGSVTVVKPAQTGVAPDEPGDLAEVTRLSGRTDVHEFARYPDPLSPHQAARLSGLPELDFADTTLRIGDLDAVHDLVIVEGAGGLLVPFTSSDRWTVADLASSLHAEVVLVTAAGLGTLNHTALTVDRLAEDGIALAGIVIGSWPAEPDLVARCNVADLAAMAPEGRLAGALPAGMSAVRDFRRQ